MKTIAELQIEIQQSKAVIESEKNKLKSISQQICEQISSEYPIKNLVGKQSYYHRMKWGRLDDAMMTLSEGLVEKYSYLEACNIVTGAELNKDYDTFIFDSESTYVMYVGYEWDQPEEDKTSAPIYEFLVAKID
jgi:hypothetical protein